MCVGVSVRTTPQAMDWSSRIPFIAPVRFRWGHNRGGKSCESTACVEESGREGLESDVGSCPTHHGVCPLLGGRRGDDRVRSEVADGRHGQGVRGHAAEGNGTGTDTDTQAAMREACVTWASA